MKDASAKGSQKSNPQASLPKNPIPTMAINVALCLRKKRVKTSPMQVVPSWPAAWSHDRIRRGGDTIGN